MSGTIETVTDKSRFEEIFQNSIFINDVFLRTANGNLKIKFMGYTSGLVAMRIPYIKRMPETALVFARYKETTIYIELKTQDKQENEIFVFAPTKVQMIHTARQEGRATVAGGGKNLVFATDATSDFLLFDGIKREKKKVEFLRDKILTDLKKIFTEAKVFFCSEETGDARMKFFYENANKPLHIPDITKPPEKGSESTFSYYREYIYLKEQFNMKRKGLISEICVPILFKKMVPFGFIQINNTVPLNESYIQLLHRAADLAANAIYRSSIFTDICSERLLVSDMSKNGIGIVFRDRRFIRYFKEKNINFIDLQLGGGLVIPMSTIVRSITLLENKVIKVGCMVREIDPALCDKYYEYLAAHLPAERPQEKPAEDQKKETSKKSDDAGGQLVT